MDLATAAAAAQNGYNTHAGQSRIQHEQTSEQTYLTQATYQLGLYNYYMGYADTMPPLVPTFAPLVAGPQANQ